MSRTRWVGLASAPLLLLTAALAADPEPQRWVKVAAEKAVDLTTLAEATPAPEVTAKDAEGGSYMLIRADQNTIGDFRRRGLRVTDATQSDFVRRFYNLSWKTDAQRTALLEAGLDLVEFDAARREALARATDGEVYRLRNAKIDVKPNPEFDRLADRARTEILTAPDAGAYHTYAEMRDELNALAKKFPKQAQVHEVGSSVKGVKILAIEVGNRGGPTPTDRPQALVLGCHHAREWISVEVPLRLAKELLENPDGNPTVKSLVNTSRIWIIPMVNPDGHNYSVTTDRMWRKNLRNNGDGTLGVDLNRNYNGPDWGKSPGSSGSTSSEIYHGPSGFSEPESRAIRDLVVGPNRLKQLRGLITYHSFSQLILYPWGYTNSTAPGVETLKKQAVKYRNEITKAGGVSYTPEQASDLYITNGDTTDWVWQVTDNKVRPYTVELRPKDMFGGGFILPESQIEPTWKENKPAILGLLKEWTTSLAESDVEEESKTPAAAAPGKQSP